MGINLSTNDTIYADLRDHVGHDIEIGSYGKGVNIAIECITCGVILLDADQPEEDALVTPDTHCDECGLFVQYDGHLPGCSQEDQV